MKQVSNKTNKTLTGLSIRGADVNATSSIKKVCLTERGYKLRMFEAG